MKPSLRCSTSTATMTCCTKEETKAGHDWGRDVTRNAHTQPHTRIHTTPRQPLPADHPSTCAVLGYHLRLCSPHLRSTAHEFHTWMRCVANATRQWNNRRPFLKWACADPCFRHRRDAPALAGLAHTTMRGCRRKRGSTPETRASFQLHLCASMCCSIAHERLACSRRRSGLSHMYTESEAMCG